MSREIELPDQSAASCDTGKYFPDLFLSSQKYMVAEPLVT